MKIRAKLGRNNNILYNQSPHKMIMVKTQFEKRHIKRQKTIYKMLLKSQKINHRMIGNGK